MLVARYASRAALLIVLAFGSGMSARALAQELVPNAVAKILKRNSMSQKNIGLYLAWADGRPIAQLNLDRTFNPASAIKLVTSMAALAELGIDHKWESSLLAAAPVVDGSLRGDLYFRGSGDPQLTTERLVHLVVGLQRRGIRHVAGDIVVDDTLFDLPIHDPAAFDGRGSSLYNAPPGAAVVNFGANNVVIRSDSSGLTVFLDPPSSTFLIANKLKLQRGRCTGNWRARLGENLKREADGSAMLSLRGRFATGCGERSFNMLGQSDPVAHAAGAVGGIIMMQGGSVAGTWRRDKTPRNAKVIAAVESKTLAEAIRGMNKHSNNFMARNIFLSLAGKTGRKPYTLDEARKVAYAWFSQQGIDTTGLQIENGSGLSRTTRITPRQFGDALYRFNKSPLRHELIASLAILGRDGTVRNWNRSSRSAGGAHLKTGTLSNARATVGYVHNPAGDIIFVVLAETRATALARRAIQEMLEWSYRLPLPKPA